MYRQNVCFCLCKCECMSSCLCLLVCFCVICMLLCDRHTGAICYVCVCLPRGSIQCKQGAFPMSPIYINRRFLFVVKGKKCKEHSVLLNGAKDLFVLDLSEYMLDNSHSKKGKITEVWEREVRIRQRL